MARQAYLFHLHASSRRRNGFRQFSFSSAFWNKHAWTIDNRCACAHHYVCRVIHELSLLRDAASNVHQRPEASSSALASCTCEAHGCPELQKEIEGHLLGWLSLGIFKALRWSEQACR